LATSYAWFGLVDAKTKKPLRNAIKADGPESQARLKLAAPDSAAASIGWAIRLIHEFGTLGSRSRGGWGSVTVDGDGLEGPFDPSKVTVPWQRCLQSDWAQGIARCDLGPWIWESQKPYSEWHQAMSLVAEERRAARQFLKQPDGDLRKALGFAGTGRMPSPLRWKLVEDRSGGLKVRIFAMPHALPRDSGESLSAEHLQRAWRDVARHLDSSANLQRAFEA
jgi:CRISPR-associated protein Cmr1